MQSLCPKCTFAIQDTFFYCPNCGYKLKEDAGSPSIGKQILLYSLAFLLPPFGLIPGIKYFRSPNGKTKTVGIVMVTLTVISIAVMVVTVQIIMAQYSSLLNGQMSGYGTLGL